MTAEALAVSYCQTAEKLIGAEQFRALQVTPIGRMTEEEAKAALIAACWELAVHRLALALACGDVSAGFGQRVGRAVLPAKPQPEAIT